MKTIKNILGTYARSCLNCGSFFPNPSLLCRTCQKTLLARPFAGLQISFEHGLKTYVFFEWNPGESDVLSGLFLALKGDRQKQAWEFWAHQLLRERLLHWPEKQLVFIPAPSSDPKRKHALFMAQALAEQSGGICQDVLTKTNKSHQRGKSRQQRSRLDIQQAVKIAGINSNWKVILVDDVLTTGATAHSCYLALGSPQNFEIWALGKRSVPCGLPLDLL